MRFLRSTDWLWELFYPSICFYFVRHFFCDEVVCEEETLGCDSYRRFNRLACQTKQKYSKIIKNVTQCFARLSRIFRSLSICRRRMTNWWKFPEDDVGCMLIFTILFSFFLLRRLAHISHRRHIERDSFIQTNRRLFSKIYFVLFNRSSHLEQHAHHHRESLFHLLRPHKVKKISKKRLSGAFIQMSCCYSTEDNNSIKKNKRTIWWWTLIIIWAMISFIGSFRDEHMSENKLSGLDSRLKMNTNGCWQRDLCWKADGSLLSFNLFRQSRVSLSWHYDNQ